MPEVGVHGRESFDLLGRTGDVDRRGEQFPFGIPEEEDFDPLIFRPFDPAKVRQIRGAVHLGMAIGVDRSPILGHHGMSQPPADATRLALARPSPPPRRPGSKKIGVLRRLHDAVLGNLVFPFLHDGRRVRVGGVEQEFLAIEVGSRSFTRRRTWSRTAGSIVTRSHEIMIA